MHHIGQAAVDAGLVDAIVWDKAEVIRMLCPPEPDDPSAARLSLFTASIGGAGSITVPSQDWVVPPPRSC